MNLNRRDFIKNTAALSAALVLANSEETEAKKLKKFGVQLYSVRDLMPKDAKGTMSQLAAMGYKQFESYAGEQGFLWGMSGKEAKSFLDGLGVEMVSTHFDMTTNLEKSIEMANEAGIKYLLCPYLGPQKTLDAWKEKAELFNKIGEKVVAGGLKFGYHNHDYSFKPLDGVVPHELLLDNTDPKNVMFELDICWIVAAGHDMVAHLKKYKKRYELCHIKDMVKIDGKVQQKNLGEGSINFADLLKKTKANSMKYYLVEQEQYPGASIESMRADAEYMKKLSF
jgi:sugar phosphate isomerase/epimerase